MPTPPKSIPLPLATGDSAPWYSQGLRFACTQCGNCCSGGPGYVWTTEADWTKIADYLHITVQEFTKTYVRRVGTAYSLIEKPNFDCIFLTREGGAKNGKAGCSIYPVRPMQCRTWPFWNSNLNSPQAWTKASQTCPGMCDASAPRYDLPHIEKNRTHPESP